MYPKNNLKDLEKQIKIDLENFNIPPKDWISSVNNNPPIVIIGAGMSALCLAFALKIKGIPCILFEKKEEGYEGAWLSPALMENLRSPKNLTGPALISPSLTFQAWYKAQFGVTQWNELEKIPRVTWHRYLQWFKTIIAPKIYYKHELIDLVVERKSIKLTFKKENEEQIYTAEHCVLAMGMDSLSSPNIPDYASHLPQKFWEHSYAGTDYTRFKGKNIGVVGSSAGAMDSAATALEHGAEVVEILCRTDDFPRVNRSKAASNQGYLSSYAYWSDTQKWDFQYYLKKEGTPPPFGSTLRVSKHGNAYFNFNETIDKVVIQGNKLHVYTEQHHFILDHLIFATGFKLDWTKNIWLERLQHQVKKWKEVYTPEQSQSYDEMGEYPYLSPDFEFTPKVAESLDVSRLYCFNYNAHMSQGPLVGMIGGVAKGAETLAEALAKKIYIEQYSAQINHVKASEDFELQGDEWITDKTYRNTKRKIE